MVTLQPAGVMPAMVALAVLLALVVLQPVVQTLVQVVPPSVERCHWCAIAGAGVPVVVQVGLAVSVWPYVVVPLTVTVQPDGGTPAIVALAALLAFAVPQPDVHVLVQVAPTRTFAS